jgi:exodeoxyribonuclease-3
VSPGDLGSRDGAVRVATWNVNSVRSRTEQLVAWLDQWHPDVVLLQETKCSDADFPTVSMAGLGYDVAHHGTDHWNGVAILSRVGLRDVARGFPGINRSPYDEARVVSANCGGTRFHSVYAPNGRSLDDPHYLFKLVWLERLRGVIDTDVATIVGGDLNVAPADIDIYDPKRWRRRTHASAPERAAIGSLLDLGLVDVTRDVLPGPGVYTWWGYRAGMFETNRGLRLDLVLATRDLASRVTEVRVDTVTRGLERPSDHAPVIVDLA